MEQVQVRQAGGHQAGIGQTVAGIVLGVAGDAQRPRHRFLDGALGAVGRARGTLALAVIHRDAEAAVGMELQGLQLALADLDRQADVLGEPTLRRASAPNRFAWRKMASAKPVSSPSCWRMSTS